MDERPQPGARRILIPAVDPDSGQVVELHLPAHRLQWAKKMGVGAIKELAESVPAVLRRPSAVYEGLRRDPDDDRGDTEGWRCFSGKPARRYNYKTGAEMSMINRVLLVFVNEDQIIYQHRWEEEDAHEPGTPADKEARFRERRL